VTGGVVTLVPLYIYFRCLGVLEPCLTESSPLTGLEESAAVVVAPVRVPVQHLQPAKGRWWVNTCWGKLLAKAPLEKLN
jgi:hypothetical protein